MSGLKVRVYISIYLSGDQDERRRPDILQEEEEPVTSGDNDLHDIPEIQPGTEGEMFIMR